MLLVFGVSGDFIGCYTSRGEEVLFDKSGLSTSLRLYARQIGFASVFISEEYSAEITKEKIIVGCTAVMPETFIRILKAAKKVGLLTDEILENLKEN